MTPASAARNPVRYAIGPLLGLLMLLLAFVAGCTDTPLDSDTAQVKLREERWMDSLLEAREELQRLQLQRVADSLRFVDSLEVTHERWEQDLLLLSDSLRIAREMHSSDSLRFIDALKEAEARRTADSVRYADSLAHCMHKPRLSAIIYFKSGLRQSAPVDIDSLSFLKVITNTGSVMPQRIELRLLGRIAEQFNNNSYRYDAPTLIHLHVRMELDGGRGVRELKSDPLYEKEGNALGVAYRFSPDTGQVRWMGADGAINKGIFEVKESDPNRRTIIASMTASFKEPVELQIERIQFTFMY